MAALKDPLEERFCQEYSRHRNGDRAIVAAGFGYKSLKDKSSCASVMAHKLLKNSKITRRIAELQEQRLRRLELDELKVLRELKRVGFADLRKAFKDGDLARPEDWDEDTAAAISSIELEKLFQPDPETGRRAHVGYTTKIKLWNKVDALRQLGEYFGLFDKLESPKGPTINADNVQVNMYLPENGRHHGNRSNGSAGSGSTVVEAVSQEGGGYGIALPAKRHETY